MARLFDDANVEYLIGSNPVSNHAFTMGCWFNVDNDAIEHELMALTDNTGASNMFLMQAAGQEGGDPVRIWAATGTGSEGTESLTGFTTNTWHHACTIFASGTSRSAYIDGGSKDTGIIDIGNLADIDTLGIGAGIYNGGTILGETSGSIAEAAVWNAALTDAEVSILALGYSPLFVRPQNLVFYMPLVRDEDNDLIGGLNFTAVSGNSGPAVSKHPPIIYPANVRVGVPEAAPPTEGVAQLIFLTGELA